LIGEKRERGRERVGSCLDDEFHDDADAVDVNAKAKPNASVDDIVAFVALQLSISIAKCSRIGIGTNTLAQIHTHTLIMPEHVIKGFCPPKRATHQEHATKLSRMAPLSCRALTYALCEQTNILRQLRVLNRLVYGFVSLRCFCCCCCLLLLLLLLLRCCCLCERVVGSSLPFRFHHITYKQLRSCGSSCGFLMKKNCILFKKKFINNKHMLEHI